MSLNLWLMLSTVVLCHSVLLDYTTRREIDNKKIKNRWINSLATINYHVIVIDMNMLLIWFCDLIHGAYVIDKYPILMLIENNFSFRLSFVTLILLWIFVIIGFFLGFSFSLPFSSGFSSFFGFQNLIFGL